MHYHYRYQKIMAPGTHQPNGADGSLLHVLAPSYDDNFDPESPLTSPLARRDERQSISATLHTANYDAATIRAEFKNYQSILPHPDELLQEKHSTDFLRTKIETSGMELPRFLKHKFEGGIKPHHALCCLLLSECEVELGKQKAKGRHGNSSGCPSWVRLLSFGFFYPQLNNPADFIRDQFYRVAHAIPTEVVTPSELRKKIIDSGLPVPNYFLDPDDDKQFPPHVALLVILQDGEQESRMLDSTLNWLAFSFFAFVALLLRIVLDVIGGAGAIWGGAECFGLRTADNRELWRWLSVGVGALCFARFLALNAPYKEDEGDILGPAGPWSLRLPVRLRAVIDHPFHYFMRALPPSCPKRKDQ